MRNPFIDLLADGRDQDFFGELLRRAPAEHHPAIRGAWMDQKRGTITQSRLQALLDLATQCGVLSVQVILAVPRAEMH